MESADTQNIWTKCQPHSMELQIEVFHKILRVGRSHLSHCNKWRTQWRIQTEAVWPLLGSSLVVLISSTVHRHFYCSNNVPIWSNIWPSEKKGNFLQAISIFWSSNISPLQHCREWYCFWSSCTVGQNLCSNIFFTSLYYRSCVRWYGNLLESLPEIDGPAPLEGANHHSW